MIGGRETLRYVESLAEGGPKVGSKFGSSIGNDIGRNTMFRENMKFENFGEVGRCDLGSAGDEKSHFWEPTDYYKDRVEDESLEICRRREFVDEVHGERGPRSIRDR